MRPSAIEGVDVLHARFFEHRFDRHSHETWSFGVTHAGQQTFSCRGTKATSTPGKVIVFRPDDAHDGHAGDTRGFHYEMVYVPHAQVDRWLREAGRPASGGFRQALLDDAGAARALALSAEALGQPQEALRAQALLSGTIVGLFERHAGAAIDGRRIGSGGWLQTVRDYLESHFDSDVKVDELVAIAGVSRVHLSRSFVGRFGVPPHVYLNNVRLRQARRLLQNGHGIAQAAAAAGFADQSHFTRRFKGSFGLTPKAWLQARLPSSALRLFGDPLPGTRRTPCFQAPTHVTIERTTIRGE